MPWRQTRTRASGSAGRLRSNSCWRRSALNHLPSGVSVLPLAPSPPPAMLPPPLQIPAELITLEPDQLARVDEGKEEVRWPGTRGEGMRECLTLARSECFNPYRLEQSS